MSQQNISNYFSKNPINNDAGPSINAIDDDEMVNFNSEFRFDSEHEELEEDVLPGRDFDEFEEVICNLVSNFNFFC